MSEGVVRGLLAVELKGESMGTKSPVTILCRSRSDLRAAFDRLTAGQKLDLRECGRVDVVLQEYLAPRVEVPVVPDGKGGSA